jgi:RNA polymerase sigma-70 factor (ECF subfamily)
VLAPALVNRSPLVDEKAGQPLALADVYRRHARDVGRWAARLGGPATDVEDVVQEVFLAAHRKLGGFRGDASLSTWLYRITENVVRHRRRKDRWRRWLGGTADETAGDLAAPGPSPLEALRERQATERVYRVLDAMKEKYRTVLILFELEELSGDEVARLTGTKLATVWVWLHRARADFAKRLTELDAQEPS